MDGARRRPYFRATGSAATAAPLPRRLLWPAGWADSSARLFIGCACLTILIPFLAVSVPPLVDYPNHLARFWLLSGGARTPALSPFYVVDWSKASTNIGVDLVVAGLSAVVPAGIAGFLAAMLAAACPPIGLIILSRTVFHRFHPWQVLFPLTAWSTTFLMGFLNFQIGIGLALLLAAADPWLRRRLRGCVGPARTVLGALLAVDHPYAPLFYASLVFALTFGEASVWPARWRGLAKRIAVAVIAAVWCVLPLLPLAVFARTLPGSDAQSGRLVYGLLVYKLFALVTPLSAYNLIGGVMITAALVGTGVWLVGRGALQAHTGLALVGAMLVALCVLAPDHAAGGSWIAQRFPTMALLVLFGAVRLAPEGAARWGPRFMASALALVLAQSAWVTWNWRAMEKDIGAVRRAVATIPPGARILPLQHDPTLSMKWSAPSGRYMSSIGDPTFRHYAALATPLRRAFVPTLFSARGLQPLQVVGDWDRQVEHNGGPLASVSRLDRPWRVGDPVYLRDWRSGFDYLLVMNADLPDSAGPFRPPSGVTLVSDTGFAQLWKVTAQRAVDTGLKLTRARIVATPNLSAGSRVGGSHVF
jgi:hypothetical protein